MSKKTKTRTRNKIRARVEGSSLRPRLVVTRSNKYIYAQAIDDAKGHTIASAKGDDAKVVGESIAKALVKNKITSVVFDRAGYVYHGRVKVLADSAREGGLKF